MKNGIYQEDGSVVWEETGKNCQSNRPASTPPKSSRKIKPEDVRFGRSSDGRRVAFVYLDDPKPTAAPAPAPAAAPKSEITFGKIILSTLKGIGWLVSGLGSLWCAAGSNLSDRDYAQWFYGTGRYAGKK